MPKLTTNRIINQPAPLPPPFVEAALIDYPPGLGCAALHTHPCYQLVWVHEGEFSFGDAAGRVQQLRPGEASVIVPGHPHNWRTGDGRLCRTLSIYYDSLNGDRYGELACLTNDRQLGEWWQVSLNQRETAPLWRALRAEFLRPRAFTAAFLGGLFMALLARVAGAAREQRQLTDDWPRPLRQAVALMEARVDRPPSLAELAEHCHLSAGRLHQLFRRHARTSPMEYFQVLRLRRAELLLAYGDLTVGEVARQLGFASIHYFSRAFKRYAQRPPSALRGARLSEFQDSANLREVRLKTTIFPRG